MTAGETVRGRRRPNEADDRDDSRSRAERARNIADVLRHQITAGAFLDGVLPDEPALGRHLGASRNAVRQALSLLRAEGLIERRQGVGTIVVMAKLGHGLNRLAGLAEALVDAGPVSNEVRAAYRVPNPPEAIVRRLGLAPGQGAVYLERLRHLGGMPLSLDSTYLTDDIGAAVLDRDLAGRDVFALIEEITGQALGSAEISVHAVIADPDTANLLQIPTGAAVFAIERLTRLQDGRPVDAESMHIRADRLTLQAVLHRASDGITGEGSRGAC
jgi:GntR family transcriptional regulator